jgi:hypothetical protein
VGVELSQAHLHSADRAAHKAARFHPTAASLARHTGATAAAAAAAAAIKTADDTAAAVAANAAAIAHTAIADGRAWDRILRLLKRERSHRLRRW